MIKIHKQTAALVIFISLLHCAVAQQASSKPIQLPFAREYLLSKGQQAFYSFQIASLQPEFDLSIIARPANIRTDPDLYISTINMYPNSTSNSQYSSTSYGYSSIYIPSSELVEGQFIYLGVVCKSSSCDFNLTLDYAKDYFLGPNYDDLSIQFVHHESLVLRVAIPKNDEAERIVFSVEVDNEYAIDEEIFMFINQGNTIPDSSVHNMYAGLAWRDGKAASISREDPLYCTGCNYTVVLQAPLGALLQFHKTLYGAVINFNFDSSRYDVVEKMRNVTYMVDLRGVEDLANETIIIEVNPYFGFPTFYVNMNELPTNFSDYTWQMQEFGVSKLSITPNERAEVASKPKALYVTVTSSIYASYFIIIKGRGKLSNHIYLGEYETGYALKGEGVHYTFFIDAAVNTSLAFNLLQEGGGNSDLFLKQCQDKDGCFFNDTEVSNLYQGSEKVSESYPIVLFSANQKGDQHLAVNLDPSKCDHDTTRKYHTCVFAVMVNNQDDKTSHYSLVVDAPDRLTPLMTGFPIKHHILEGEQRYFYYTVTNDSDIDAISFQLTEISGYVIIFISRTERYPDAQNSDEALFFDDKISYTRNSSKFLNGTYYLGALGASAATFTIVPILSYTNQSSINTSSLVQLSQGMPQKAVLRQTDIGLYVVKTNYEYDDEIEAMEIILDNLQGAVQICVNNNNTAPIFDKCTWKTNTSRLVIDPNDENFEMQANYIIAVFPRKRINGTWDTTFSYTITYTTLMHFNDLMTGYSLYPWISSNHTAYYKFLLYPDTDIEATISVQSMNQQDRMGLYISANALGLTNLSVYNYSKIANQSLVYTLNREQIKTLCSQRAYMFMKCYAYVALTTNNSYDIFPSIMLRKDFTEMKLSEGNELDFIIPSNNHTLKFYFLPYKMEDLSISVNSFSRALSVYVKTIDTTQYSGRNSWPFPNDTFYDYMNTDRYNDQTLAEVIVPAADFSVCGTDSEWMTCAVLISVQTYNVSGFTSGDSDDCSIVASQEITPVKFGTPVKSSVAENSYKYFKLKVDRDTADLLISLTVLTEGEAYLLISYGDDQRPNIYNCEFWTYSGTSESVQLGNSDLPYQTSMAGYWILAIYGGTAVDFTLSVVYEDHRIIELWEGYPQNLELGKNDMMYFNFWIYRPKDLKIILSPTYGSASFYISTWLEEDSLIGNLPSPQNYYWGGNTEALRNVILISKDDDNLCEYCNLVIGVSSHDDLKATITLTGADAFIFLTPQTPILDYCNAGGFNKYEFTFGSTKAVDIDILVHANAPNIYVSHNPSVNASNYLWKYESGIADGGVIKMKLDNSEYLGQNLESIWDGTRYQYSSPDKFYVYITSELTSNFTITASRNNMTIKLYDGVLAQGFLNSYEHNKYTYVSAHSASEKHRIKAVLTIYRDEFSSINGQINPDVHVTFTPKGSDGEYQNVEIIRSDEVNSLHGPVAYRQLIQFIADKGTFQLSVTNNDENGALNYTLVINGHQSFSLPLDTFYLSRLALNDNDKFTIHAGSSGDVVLQVFECFGKIGIEVSKSPVIFNKNLLDDLEESGDVQLYFIDHSVRYIKVPVDESGTVYVKITAFDGLVDNDEYPDQEAVYKIQASLFQKGKAPLSDYIFPGNDGQLQYDLNNQLSIKFVEPTVLFSSGNPNNKPLTLNYKYDLFVASNDKVVESLARCDFMPNTQGIFANLPTNYFNKTFSNDEIRLVPGQPYHQVTTDLEDLNSNSIFATMRVTVYGVRQDGSIGWNYPVVYNTIEANVGSSGSPTSLKVLLVSCAFVLVGAIIGLVIYVRKYKKVKARLMYETQDIRNVAASVDNDDNLEKEIERGPKEKYIELVNEPREKHLLQFGSKIIYDIIEFLKKYGHNIFSFRQDSRLQ